ncbi:MULTISPECIES: DUF935 family protein [unclassified Acinetobacter]|uniref:phage portal protein family protein n=1 Tax=unclassified Acinetobacter TaxID=196816 RepID=UPI0024484735|nr:MULTISPECIES: DUF935 family protein [unclassified Acinetobacter]MDH0031349.1 DUF935 domain-containing protein [Acinetobacter sp. GD04021]MDH0887166.1 DUF935 domain-containing protein [Acinetobacter sp. GD03873]MDH1083545.1 DUF935 domain-containing protein [Acinetobacter sp. GD03983]MDH2190482.1 DUF935 domain-containing protein [Acinetobacter sp. GD03645]MDH2204072.1 DUF935 domain-containing protein [Acinetobacter sp. GD03647]
MAKSKNKDKSPKKALSYGNLYSQEAVTQFLINFGRQPDTDEVLRKAGIARHKLKVLLDDDEIAQAVETRIDALLATPFRLEPSDTNEAELLNIELKEWFFEIASGSLNALLFGYSVQEAVYEFKPDGYVGLQWIGEKPMQWFEPKNDGRLIYRQDGTGREQEVDQKLKFFLTRRKASYEQPYGKALLATLYWLFFFKQNGFKFWAKFLERFGTPILLGKVDTTDTGDMAEALLNAHAQSVLAIDKDDDVQVLTAGSNGTAGSSFDMFHTVLIRQIQKVVLGQTLTSGTDGTGSRALGEVHENVRQDKLKSDMRLIVPTLQAVVDALCLLNGWQEHKIILGEKPKTLNKDQADRDAVLSSMGVQFSKNYLVNAYGFEEGDIEATSKETVIPQFTALPQRAFSFAANVKNLSPAQQEVEELTDDQGSIELLSQRQVNELLQQSETPEALAFNLMQLMPGVSRSSFTANLERALYAGDVLGYVTASGGK